MSANDGELRILGMTMAWFCAAIAAILIVIYGSVALYRGSWELTRANAARSYQLQKLNTDRQTQILHDSYSYQSATASDLTHKISDITDETTQMDGISPSSLQWSDLHAQRLGEAKLACADAVQLTRVPSAQAGWVRQNCLAGTVSPASPLEK